jgi:ribosomal protein S4
VPTIYAAKQLISHKKVKVNNHANSSFSRLLKTGDIISFDLSTHLAIQTNLSNQLENFDFYLSNSSQIEVNFKTLKLIVLTDKINLLSQIPQYKFPLNWNTIING